MVFAKAWRDWADQPLRIDVHMLLNQSGKQQGHHEFFLEVDSSIINLSSE